MTYPKPSFVVLLSSAIQIDGFTTRAVGPFPTLDSARKWAVENDATLDAKGVRHALVESLLNGKITL